MAKIFVGNTRFKLWSFFYLLISGFGCKGAGCPKEVKTKSVCGEVVLLIELGKTSMSLL